MPDRGDSATPLGVHTCHADCPCQHGGQPVSDFVEDTMPTHRCTICGGPLTRTQLSVCDCLDRVAEFTDAMRSELVANAHKGGRGGANGWAAQDYRVLVGEVLYHAAKLSYAARQFAQGDGGPEQVVEFAADTANMAMMVADALGALR